ncbi:hypothetical protein ACX80D_14705 [Arthrobacter sp. Sr24]
MNEAARRRLKNPPPKALAGWIFAAAAIFGVAARLIYLTDGPMLLARILISIAVVLAAVSFWIKLRRWWLTGKRPPRRQL